MDITKQILEGLASDLPLCNAMSSLLAKLFNCDYVFIFIYNERWNRLIERVLRASPMLPTIKFNPGLGPDLVKTAVKEPFILDADSTEKIGLNPSASVIVASTGDNIFLRGAVAIARDNGVPWDKNDLEKLGVIIMLIIRCYELSVSLVDNQQYANTIVESVDTAIYAISTDGTMIHFNRAAEKIFGYPASWAIGRHYFETLVPKVREGMKRSLDYVLSTGKSYEGHLIEFTRLDDQVIYVNTSIYPWLSGEGEIMGAIGIVTDETENKRFQEQLVRAERMAILGKIAAQVFHEVRSPLASIRGFARIIEKNEKPGSTYREYAETMIEQVDRINAVVQELLDFSKPEEIMQETVDINRALRKALEISEIDRGKVTIIEYYDENLGSIKGDHQKIESVFVNLLNNAYHSLGEVGLIDISTGTLPDNRVIVRIKDNGSGIPKQHLNKIFDPYFTTKSSGTGLGLAIVQQIVNNHGARIRVNSDVGLGSSFEIEFPSEVERNRK